MTCSAGDLLTSREAAHPAACSPEASWIKHKPLVHTERAGAPGRVNDPLLSPQPQAYGHVLSGLWRRTSTGYQETRGVHSSFTTGLAVGP